MKVEFPSTNQTLRKLSAHRCEPGFFHDLDLFDELSDSIYSVMTCAKV